jgi:hypothetical protein
MARQTIEVSTCDCCDKEAANGPFLITTDSGTVEVDLCAEHAAPVLEIIAKGRPVNAKRPPGPRGSQRANRQAQHSIEPFEG